MNGDGRLDIISGCYSGRGGKEMVAPVWVLYRNEDGSFAKPTALKREGDEHILASDGDFLKPTTDRICTEPFAFDHDGDGDLDLLIGNFTGTFVLATNEGSKTEPNFKNKPTWVKTVDGELLRLQGNNHGAPYVVDWDGDGDVDILSGGGAGGVQIAINNPTKDGQHAFSQFKPLIDFKAAYSPDIFPAGTPAVVGGSWRICVADYNADGKLDLVVGDCLRRIYAKDGVTVEDAKAKDAVWNEEFTKIRGEMTEISKAFREHMASKPKVGAAPDSDADGEGEAEPTGDAEAEPKPDPMEAWKKTEAELQQKMTEVRKAYSAHYKKREAHVTASAAGHVWVYLQK